MTETLNMMPGIAVVLILFVGFVGYMVGYMRGYSKAMQYATKSMDEMIRRATG